jgi:hypothetical protein
VETGWWMISRGHLSSIDTEYWICVNIQLFFFDFNSYTEIEAASATP